MPRALVIAPPTIDIISGRMRPGGPGLYSGLALSMLGYDVFLYGPIGWLTLLTIHVETMLGLRRLGYYTPWSMGAVFKLEETFEGRKATVLSRPPALDVDDAISIVSRLEPDIVILSPVYGEDCILASLLNTGIVTVDVQGYSRSGLECPRFNAHITHVSIDDSPFSSLPSCSDNTLVYTLGERGAVVVDGCRWILVPGPDETLDDGTGAGDVFTALFTHYFRVSGDAELASLQARSLTPGVLREAQGSIESLASGLLPGGFSLQVY